MIDFDKDYSDRKSLKDDLADLYDDIQKGFDNKAENNDDIARFWDVFNCTLNDQQAYVGENCVYLPLIRDAIEARVTRHTNMLFPDNGRHVEVVAMPGDQPNELISLLDHYVSASKLRALVPALLRAGDVTGQINVLMDWKREERTIQREARELAIGDQGIPLEDKPSIAVIVEEKVVDQRPEIIPIATEDMIVLPPTVEHIDDAEIVAIQMWVTKRWLKARVKEGLFDKKDVEELTSEGGLGAARTDRPNPAKSRTEATGVKVKGGVKTYCIVRCWTKIDFGGDEGLMPAEVWFASADLVLSCRHNPFWCQKVPIISIPIKKIAGSFWGQSPIKMLERLQYAANDAVNIGLDSAQYALMPIVMTDPESNPKVGSMVMAMAAIWQTNPQTTQFAKFPNLIPDALTIVQDARAQIQISLGVNSSMIPTSGQASKPSQAKVAQEQAISLEIISDVVRTLEDGLLSPILERMFEYDQQFRDEEILVKAFGSLGNDARMLSIPPQQWENRYWFRWWGAESFRSQQMLQQKTAGLNVLRGIQGPQLAGREIDLSPIVEEMVGQLYGSRMAPKILIDNRHKLTVPVDEENYMLMAGHPVRVSPFDDDREHVKGHAPTLEFDKSGVAKAHVMEHMTAMQAKAQRAFGMQGGGGGPKPQAMPQPGAQVQPPTGPQQPPGAMHPDQMQDPNMMPRKLM